MTPSEVNEDILYIYFLKTSILSILSKANQTIKKNK